MTIRSRLSATMTAALRPFGAVIVPTWKWREVTKTAPWLTFEFGGVEYPFFMHRHNCGGHPRFGTERMVELALADRWLDLVVPDEVIEVGAVTPYYWPGRVRDVVDPADSHPRVHRRLSILDLDMRGKAVLCISTLEHVGSGEYGLPEDPTLMRKAIDKVFAEARTFLITVPTGYSEQMDRIVTGDLPDDVSQSFLVRRERHPFWAETPAPDARSRVYARWTPDISAHAHGANSIAVLERGGLLSAATAPPGSGGNGTGQSTS